MATVLLVRHGRTTANATGLLAGRTAGVALDSVGKRQAATTAERIGAVPLAAVVSSPCQRAQETAVPIAAALRLEVATDAGLDEIDFGDWTGMTFEALQGVPGWQAWNQFRGTAPTPGGEMMLEALGRALRCLARWREAVPDGEVVLVGHQDVLKAVLVHSLGAPIDLMQRIELGAGSCSVLRVFGDGGVLMESCNLAH
jgi:broad specificity phosphatase PhoE